MNAVAPNIAAEPELLQLHAGENSRVIAEPDDRTIIHCDRRRGVWVTAGGDGTTTSCSRAANRSARARGGKVILQALIATAAVSIKRACPDGHY
jgi:hypothetical protein